MPTYSEKREQELRKENAKRAEIEHDEKQAGYWQTREAKKQQSREDAIYRYEHSESIKKKKDISPKEKELRIREQELAERKRERELRRGEKEYKHPVRTRAIRRAEKMAGLGIERAQQTASTATRVAGGRLRAVASRARVSPTTRRLPRDKPGRTRLPVFQEGAPSFAERIALDFGTKQPEDVLQGQQQPLLASKPLDLFGEGKQYDLGLGNGNKKKVRYY